MRRAIFVILPRYHSSNTWYNGTESQTAVFQDDIYVSIGVVLARKKLHIPTRMRYTDPVL